MTVTMEQMVTFKNNINYFNSLSLPLKSAYKLNKINKAVDKEVEFYAEKFQEILNSYARKDESGNYVMSEDNSQILIEDGKAEECNKALEELQNMEVEIDTYNLNIDDFGDIQCTPEQLDSIMPFME